MQGARIIVSNRSANQVNSYSGAIETLKDDEVFVFGANSEGFSGAGAAGYATFGESGNVWRKYEYDKKPKGWKGRWTEKGKVGPQIGNEGKSYGLVTVTKAGAKRSLSSEEITHNISVFYQFAQSRPHLKFYVAQSSKGGLNGYSAAEMAQMYLAAGEAPANVYFEESFTELLKAS